MTICDICLKETFTEKINIHFQNSQPMYINLCPVCKHISQDYYIILCEECGALELWNKEFYAPKLKLLPDKKITILMTKSCLNCYQNNKFYRG